MSKIVLKINQIQGKLPKMHNDNRIVIDAKNKLNDLWSNLLHYWDDDFKRVYEKDILNEIFEDLDKINDLFISTLEKEETYITTMEEIYEAISDSEY